jgi:hypothetical protein
MIPPENWEALRRVGVEATKKYPKDEVIEGAAKEVEKVYMMRAVKEKPPN